MVYFKKADNLTFTKLLGVSIKARYFLLHSMQTNEESESHYWAFLSNKSVQQWYHCPLIFRVLHMQKSNKVPHTLLPLKKVLLHSNYPPTESENHIIVIQKHWLHTRSFSGRKKSFWFSESYFMRETIRSSILPETKYMHELSTDTQCQNKDSTRILYRVKSSPLSFNLQVHCPSLFLPKIWIIIFRYSAQNFARVNKSKTFLYPNKENNPIIRNWEEAKIFHPQNCSFLINLLK